MSARRLLASIICACVVAGAADSAQAALVRIDFTGTNSSPTAPNAFGTPVPDLVGFLIYDDAVAGATFSPTATNYSGAIRQLSFSIGAGGNSVFSGALANGSYGSAQVQNAAGADRLSFNNLLLSPAQLLGEVPTLTSGTAVRTFNNAQLTLAVSGGPGTIADQLLAGIDPTDFTSSATLSVFLSYTQQPGGTAGPQGFPAVSFNYNLQSVSTTQVPVPAAAWLLGSGLLSLAGIARRRRTLQG